MAELGDIINEAHQSIDHGTVYLAIKKYDGKVATIDTNSMTYHKTRDNVEALANVGTMIKLESLSLKQNPPQTPPTTTLVLYWNKLGEIDRIAVNGFKRTNLK